ncbi:MAG: ABC transporter permease [Ginsengibacter sp.]
MLKNYFKIALRNLARHKSFTAINIAGLGLGIACALLLFTVIKYELSYDKFQPEYDHIFQVVTENNFGGEISYNSGIPTPAVEALRLEFPGITVGSMFANSGSQVTVVGDKTAAKNDDKKFIEGNNFYFCDPELFTIFHYDWLVGSPAVLAEPNTTVLTQKWAEKYFGDWKKATGQYLLLDNHVLVKIAGILKDPPANSDFPLGIITSKKTLVANGDSYDFVNDWNATSSSFVAFMLLPKNVTTKSVNDKLVQFTEKYNPSSKKGVRERINYLLPLSEIHYDKRFSNFGDHTTNKSTLWTLALIGLFIILMACINFINLSTAQAIGRSKEVGIRKVLGSNRKQLFGQMMGETTVLVFISILFAFLIAMICLPFIKHVAMIQESLRLFNVQTISFLLLLCLVVVLFAGSYPAFVLSGFKPISALKNKMTSATVGGISIRRSLVVIQFAISQFLIIGTIVAITQMNFVKNADLGFKHKAIMLFNANTDSTFHSTEDAFKQKILQLPGVQAVSFNSDEPSSYNNWATNFAFDHQADNNSQVSLKFTDEDYFKTFGIQFLAGQPFAKSDTMKEFVVNETFTKLVGTTPEKAIGKQVRLGSSEWRMIVGVVKDFKTSSLKESIKPIVLTSSKGNYYVTAIKLNTADIKKTSASIENAWNDYFPKYAYKTSFVDDTITGFYAQENQLELLYKIFAGIAIFISCLGLYGLVSFMATQKTKEIGVRKVLGASVKNILFIFSKEFTILIIIGSVIAIPLAYYFMGKWLQNFTFRIEMNAGIFVVAVLISVIVAWIAVGYKSIKAALANPVDSLRAE